MTINYDVFPTGVGVNPEWAASMPSSRGIPHRRGGEPIERPNGLLGVLVFPTGVGVNRGE